MSTSLDSRLVLRVSEAAELLSVGQDEMRQLLRCGEVLGYRTAGGHWRVLSASVQEYVRRRCQEEESDRLGRATSWPIATSAPR